MMLGIDMNATRIRVVRGSAGDFALPLPLDPPGQELPLILSLANGSIEIGQAGLRLCRRQPHLVWQDFLGYLGEEGSSTRAKRQAGKHHLDATEAMHLVWKRLEPICRKTAGVVLGLPSYLSPSQAEIIRNLGTKMRMPVLGSLPLILAGALAGYAQQAWHDCVLVLDLDDHALSIAMVRAVEGQAHMLDVRHLPHLGYRVWRERLLNALADLCVLQSRRDPRAAPQAEQGLFEQLDMLLDACQKGRMAQLGVQATGWYQNLVLEPGQVEGFCAGLVRQVLREVEALWDSLPGAPSSFGAPALSFTDGGPRAVILVTELAARLPGLVPALRNFVQQRHEPVKPMLAEGDDFGDNLLGEMEHDTGSVILLGPDAVARAVHALGTHLQHGPATHLELAAPLPRPASVDLGPARLHHRGEDYLLGEHNIFLGLGDAGQLLVDDPRHAGAEARHCELVFDQRTYILFNRSRDATLVNDCPVAGSVVLHPGDWIRLGVEGPLVRFLGQTGSNRTPLIA